MAQEHRLQRQRFELKYLVSRELIPGIRGFLRCHLEPDDYGEGWPDGAYPVHSLYLDSRDLKTYMSSLNGVKNRFKLRLRYYDDRPDTPVFFEIKARVDNCMLKQRCPVRREAVNLVLAGHFPDQDLLLSREPRHEAALQRFNFLMQSINAIPKAHNAYLREAWVSYADNSVRVTIDHDVAIEPCFHTGLPIHQTHPTRVFDDLMIVELKFTNRFPDWFQDLVEHFNLMQCSASKYADGLALSGERRYQGMAPAVQRREFEGFDQEAELLPAFATNSSKAYA